MILDKSADLLDTLRSGGDLDVIREAVQLVRQALIEAEADEAIGAAHYERAQTRTTHHNGGRDRLLSTKAGDVNLRIPKLRSGSFFPSLLGPRRRIDKALWAVVMEAYVHGVSTRKVDDWWLHSASTLASASPASLASALSWTRWWPPSGIGP